MKIYEEDRKYIGKYRKLENEQSLKILSLVEKVMEKFQ